MTNDQAIKIIECLGWGYPDNEIKEAVHMAADALRNQAEADELSTPKKIIERSKEVLPGEFIHWEECPHCHTHMEYEWGGEPYCPHCGQAVDWSEVLHGIQKSNGNNED